MDATASLPVLTLPKDSRFSNGQGTELFAVSEILLAFWYFHSRNPSGIVYIVGYSYEKLVNHE